MCNYMKMITCSTDNIWMTGFIFKDTGNVWEKDSLIFDCQKGSIVFASKDQLVQNLGVGRHINDILAATANLLIVIRSTN
jgi:V8-like Glu-specific endopeptidase